MDTPPPLAPASPPFRDRRTGLIVFGVMEIMLGGFCLLLLPMTVFGQVLVAKQHGGEFDFGLVAPSLLTFLILAAGLIWLGIGSIQARRWARALLLCFGWMGLCAGLVALAVVIPTLGSMDAMMRQQGRELPAGALLFAKIVAVISIIVIYILIPGALVLFYRSANVKLTCEHRDAVPRWTDHCPLPVLAMCILQAFGAGYMVLMPRFGGTIPLAGFLVTGWPARVAWVGFAVLSAYGARGFYRLDPRAWLIYSVAIGLFGISSLATFVRIDLLDYYRAVGLPEWQIKQLATSPLVQGHFIIWLSFLSLAIFGGYLLFLRRYFVAPADSTSIRP